MSVPDQPFAPASTRTPPILQVHTTTYPPASHTPPSHDLEAQGEAHDAEPLKPQRRVQWNSQSHVVSMPSVPVSPVQQLDESNIDQVKAALERHRSGSKPRSSRPARTPSTVSTTPDEDYDYRLDIEPAEQLHAVGSGGSNREEGPAMEAFLDHDLDASQYIAPGETDGLPRPPRLKGQEPRQEAKDLVRAHTGRWNFLRRRVTKSRSERRESHDATATSTEPKNPPETQRHDEGTLHLPGIPQGSSVLSSLLKLYGRHDDRSGNTSAASSRATSEDESSEDEKRAQRTQRAHEPDTDHRDTHLSQAPPHDDSPSYPVQADNVHSHSVGSLIAPSPGFMQTMRKAAKAVKPSDRPKAARSGAGVFGALLQNTSNLSSVATPVASTLVPAAERPGYQLDRYSVPTLSVPDHPRPWRPGSQPGSRPSSRPPSPHSSTAVSRNDDDTPDSVSVRKVFSADDVAGLRGAETPSFVEKRKRPTALESVSKLPATALKEGGAALRNAEKWIMSGVRTPMTSPPEKWTGNEYFHPNPLTEDDKRRKEWEREKRRRKKAKEARKKQELFIIQHVAAILQRQQFLMKLARALMMFGSPSHRLETQIQATAKVLDINAQVIYIPGTMLVSFGDEATHTSETKFLKQGTGLDLGKLQATHVIYWNVVHDLISVDVASEELDELMTTPPYYSWWQVLIIGGLCSAFIAVVSFSGSFADALMTIPLGMLLCGTQIVAARNELFSNVFEITIATVISFISAALASTNMFCYTALVSGGVVLILPVRVGFEWVEANYQGYIVLSGALELASRNITAGAVRIGYSVIYSLFLGFGISLGVEIYTKITNLEVVGSSDYTCSVHNGKPWWGLTPSQLWYLLCCPGFAFGIALRNQQPLLAKELPVMVIIACAGWASNHFSALAFPNRSDMTSAIGSFVVGSLGAIYGKFYRGSSFPVTVPGILFQLPSGLSNGGIFNFAASDTTVGTSSAYSSGFQVAEQLISVAIGLTVGLFISAVVTHPFGGGRKRGSGIFSF